MRLVGSKVLLAVVAATVACGDSTGPTIPGVFVLRSVDGHEVPGVGAPLVQSFTPLSGSVTLEADGTAILVERRRDFTQTPFADVTITRVVSYRLDGHRIIINPDDCPPNAVCMNVIGILINSTLNLDSPFGGNFTYLYRRVSND